MDTHVGPVTLPYLSAGHLSHLATPISTPRRRPSMASHLIYHPRRRQERFGATVAYFDQPSGNQDPFIWSRQFLHSFCHMTQLRSPAIGDINFWVSSSKFSSMPDLLCDLVFVVESRELWKKRNSIQPTDPIVNSPIAYRDHYRWVKQHPFTRRNRITLKAHPTKSFQPQGPGGALLDVMPMLRSLGFSRVGLLRALVCGRGSKPLPLPPNVAQRLLLDIRAASAKRITGAHFERIRARTPALSSPWP